MEQPTTSLRYHKFLGVKAGQKVKIVGFLNPDYNKGRAIVKFCKLPSHDEFNKSRAAF